MESQVEADGQVIRRTAGLVLCGGRSRRMGTPKAWLSFGGESLLPRVVRRLSQAVDSVSVVAAPGQDVPALPAGVSIVRDPEEGHGPLAGLAAGLAAVPATAGSIFLASCDAPFLEPGFVRHILERLGSHDIAIPISEGCPQPLAAAYRVEGLLERIALVRASGKSGLIHLLRDADVRYLAPDELRDVDPEGNSLRTINTPEEYEAALRRLGTA